MKKLITNVVFQDEKGDVTYAVMFVGVMTRRNIYLKRVSHAGPDAPEMVKISRKDTKDTTASWCSDWDGPFRDIYVADGLGLEDPRIKKDCEIPLEILAAIYDAVREFEASAA